MEGGESCGWVRWAKLRLQIVFFSSVSKSQSLINFYIMGCLLSVTPCEPCYWSDCSEICHWWRLRPMLRNRFEETLALVKLKSLASCFMGIFEYARIYSWGLSCPCWWQSMLLSKFSRGGVYKCKQYIKKRTNRCEKIHQCQPTRKYLRQFPNCKNGQWSTKRNQHWMIINPKYQLA